MKQHGLVTARVYGAISKRSDGKFTIQDIVNEIGESERSIRSVIIRLASSGILERAKGLQETGRPGPNLTLYKVKDMEYLNDFIDQISFTKDETLPLGQRSPDDFRYAMERMNELVEKRIYATDPQSGIAQLRPLLKIFADFGNPDANECLIRASRLIEACIYHEYVPDFYQLGKEQKRNIIDGLQESCDYALGMVSAAFDLLRTKIDRDMIGPLKNVRLMLSGVLRGYRRFVSDSSGYSHDPETGELIGPTMRSVIPPVLEKEGNIIFRVIEEREKIKVYTRIDNIDVNQPQYTPDLPKWFDSNDLAEMVETDILRKAA